LWDIDLLINRTLVYGLLTVSIVALYVLVVVGLGTVLQARDNLGTSLLATGLVAVLFQPLRTRLQRAVNRLMYGDRDEPYRVLSRLGQRLEATLAPEAVLPTVVETVAQALKLPYVAITLQQGEEFLPAASYGSAGGDLVRLSLVYQNEAVGELVLAPRAPGESFTPGDRTLLEDLAHQAGIAVHAVRLTADLKRLTVDLQHSRERLVTAREEERRRLRRDLHDGLGPQLASLTLKLETARNRLAHDPLADRLLSDLASRTQATVADIRRLVYALRPPTLDELGPLSALRELTLQYSEQVSIHLDAPNCLPELPAAVEVALYRIAQEALTTVEWDASRCGNGPRNWAGPGPSSRYPQEGRTCWHSCPARAPSQQTRWSLPQTGSPKRKSKMERIRVLIADDNALFREGLHGLLDSVAETEVVGEATTGAEAIREAEAIFGPGIAKRVLGFFSAARPTVPARVFPELSERETELLALMAQGRSNQEIAEQVDLSLKTVRNHVSNIFSKLQVADRAQAVIRAREAGLGHGKTEG
jgi:signal transduction histidine kinase/DNA-binding CsgD family transcriptional regulator